MIRSTEDNVYWVLQERTRIFATWKPVALFRTKDAAYTAQRGMHDGHRYKVDRVELIEDES